MPRVSVIIPAFNADRHVQETLRSVLNQTYNDWEVVLCDDSSTDRTVERARAVSDRAVIVKSERNIGPAAARNLAIQHSAGELLVFLDADDYLLPTYLERQVSAYDEGQARYGNVGIVACNASLLAADGLRPQTQMDAVDFPPEVTLRRLLRSNPIFISALVPRRIVEELGGFCPELSGTEDFDLWIRIVEAGYRVLANREPLAVYRLGHQSLSSDVGAMAQDTQRTYRRALARGNLSPRERRITQRELRRQRLIERVASSDGLSYRQALHALPLLLLVIAEHPGGWRSLPCLIARGRRALAPFPS